MAIERSSRRIAAAFLARADSSAAIAVYDSTQRWGQPDRGIQLFGSAAEAEGDRREQARAVYLHRFPDFSEASFAAYHLYLFRPMRLKLFDEHTFGAATFVTARIENLGRLVWELTEVCRPDKPSRPANARIPSSPSAPGGR